MFKIYLNSMFLFSQKQFEGITVAELKHLLKETLKANLFSQFGENTRVILHFKPMQLEIKCRDFLSRSKQLEFVDKRILKHHFRSLTRLTRYVRCLCRSVTALEIQPSTLCRLRGHVAPVSTGLSLFN